MNHDGQAAGRAQGDPVLDGGPDAGGGQGIVDTLVTRTGHQPPTKHDRLRAVVIACAATSALRASVQIYRGRYPGRGLDIARLLPIVEQAFAVLEENSA